LTSVFLGNAEFPSADIGERKIASEVDAPEARAREGCSGANRMREPHFLTEQVASLRVSLTRVRRASFLAMGGLTSAF